MNKQSISPVVGTALLLVVAVVAVLSFQNWFTQYNSALLAEVESRESSLELVDVRSFQDSTLSIYNRDERNLSVKRVTVDGVVCSNAVNASSGVTEIPLGGCLDQLDGIVSVAIETDQGVLSRTINLKSESSGYAGYGDLEDNLPVGTILPFDSASCPAGWSTFSDANGRLLLGQGSGNTDKKGDPLSIRLVGDSGGLENSSGFPATNLTGTTNQPASNYFAGSDATSYHSSLSGPVDLGGNLQDSNIPPSYVLHYCIKDSGNTSLNDARVAMDKDVCALDWQETEELKARFPMGDGSGNLDKNNDSLVLRTLGEVLGVEEIPAGILADPDPAITPVANSTTYLAKGVAGTNDVYQYVNTSPTERMAGDPTNMPPFTTVKYCEPKAGAQLVSGTVIGFNSSTCPTGWSNYTKSEGRFLLGAGSGTDDGNGDALSARAFGSTGGLEYTDGGLPVADIQANESGVDSDFVLGNANTQGRGTSRPVPMYSPGTSNTTFAGEKTDSNMPPFYTIKYCVKD